MTDEREIRPDPQPQGQDWNDATAADALLPAESGEALSVARLDEIRNGGISKAPTCPIFFKQPEDFVACRDDAAGHETSSTRCIPARPLIRSRRLSGFRLLKEIG